MSAMFDYISGKRRGTKAQLEASLEHALGLLGTEIEENEKLRVVAATAWFPVQENTGYIDWGELEPGEDKPNIVLKDGWEWKRGVIRFDDNEC
jgi:hypothetical protein